MTTESLLDLDTQNIPKLDSHLLPLLEKSTRGSEKILAAWDGLSDETKIRILHVLGTQHDDGIGSGLSYNRRLIDKAFCSSNDYIRYLAARAAVLKENNQEDLILLEKIKHDKCMLVRTAQIESRSSSDRFSYLNDFIDMSHEERLAAAASHALNRPWIYCERFSKIILWCVEHPEQVIKEQLIQIVGEYASYLDPNDRMWNGDWLDGVLRWTENLWGIIPKVPFAIRDILVRKLPSPDRHKEFFPQDLLAYFKENLKEDGGVVAGLLDRKDIVLRSFRKDIFFHQDASENVVWAASCYHFKLTRQEEKKLNEAQKKAINIWKSLKESGENKRALRNLSEIFSNKDGSTVSIEEKINLIGKNLLYTNWLNNKEDKFSWQYLLWRAVQAMVLLSLIKHLWPYL